MGMSTFVVGIKPPDDHWRRMKAAWDACEEAGIEPPQSILDFFEGEKPDPAGVTIDLLHFERLEPHSSVKEWSDDYGKGYEVHVKDLPPDVTILRFYNAW